MEPMGRGPGLRLSFRLRIGFGVGGSGLIVHIYTSRTSPCKPI